MTRPCAQANAAAQLAVHEREICRLELVPGSGDEAPGTLTVTQGDVSASFDGDGEPVQRPG
jgi:hypothetical protein